MTTYPTFDDFITTGGIEEIIVDSRDESEDSYTRDNAKLWARLVLEEYRRYFRGLPSDGNRTMQRTLPMDSLCGRFVIRTAQRFTDLARNCEPLDDHLRPLARVMWGEIGVALFG